MSHFYPDTNCVIILPTIVAKLILTNIFCPLINHFCSLHIIFPVRRVFFTNHKISIYSWSKNWDFYQVFYSTVFWIHKNVFYLNFLHFLICFERLSEFYDFAFFKNVGINSFCSFYAHPRTIWREKKQG